MKRFSIYIPGDVRGMGRPRAAHFGGRTRMYHDKKDVQAQAEVRSAWEEAGKPLLWEGAYWGVRVEAMFPRPASHLKKDGTLSAEGKRHPMPGKKPDLDNVLKLVTDPLVKCGAVPDDSRMVFALVKKEWTKPGREPGTYVEVKEV